MIQIAKFDFSKPEILGFFYFLTLHIWPPEITIYTIKLKEFSKVLCIFIFIFFFSFFKFSCSDCFCAKKGFVFLSFEASWSFFSCRLVTHELTLLQLDSTKCQQRIFETHHKLLMVLDASTVLFFLKFKTMQVFFIFDKQSVL